METKYKESCKIEIEFLTINAENFPKEDSEKQVFSNTVEKELFPKVKNTVFHCTDLKGFRGIIKDSLIKANSDGSLGNNWSKNSLCRKKEGVCLFNFLNINNDDDYSVLKKKNINIYNWYANFPQYSSQPITYKFIFILKKKYS
ncbi:MAG: hypothetical protein V2B14_02940 [bacterium]